MGDTIENQKITELHYFKPNIIKKILSLKISFSKSIKILSAINRINVLFMICKAGSGHIGTSFSSMEIYTVLYASYFNNKFLFFSSKGHDAPAVYANLYLHDQISNSKFFNFRRLNGLPGHPDIKTNGIIFNTGSLGMGVSKAKGLILSNRAKKIKKRIIVIMGDGELQEGQFWESLPGVINFKMNELIIIIDHNKIQSDNFVSEVSDLGNLKKKFESFGFNVIKLNGHNPLEIKNALNKKSKQPKILIANTIKGKGVNLFDARKLKRFEDYQFHSGAPNEEQYLIALTDLKNQLKKLLSDKIDISYFQKKIFIKTTNKENKSLKAYSLVDQYSDILTKHATKNKKIMVLDADLYKDTGLKKFKSKFKERFFEFGIAEQDMVSGASGFARNNFIPMCHSFSCFITTRANEQIYNNSSENKKIIYVGTLSGIIPAGPGHSHQSLREISSLGAIPNLIIFEPSNTNDLKLILDLVLKKDFKKSLFLRLSSVRLNQQVEELEKIKNFSIGKGIELINGVETAIITYGPLNLSTSLTVVRNLKIGLINFPWLNEINNSWLKKISFKYKKLFFIESQYSKISLSTLFAKSINQCGLDLKIFHIPIEDFPPCGSEAEVLKKMNFDELSISKTISKIKSI